MKSAAVRFRSFRRSKKMTKRMLGLLLGISRRSVYNIEQGIHEPSLRHLEAFDALVERHRAVNDADIRAASGAKTSGQKS